MANGNHPINGLIDSALQNLRNLVDANTIIGQPINAADGTTIIPVSKVSFGFASGGSDLPTTKQGEPFGGGAGGGVSIQPLGFLVIHQGPADERKQDHRRPGGEPDAGDGGQVERPAQKREGAALPARPQRGTLRGGRMEAARAA